MKVLWVCPFFLHPTERGAQLRTLGLLKELHKRHEIHFAALLLPDQQDDGPRQVREYASRHYAAAHTVRPFWSPTFFVEAFRSLFSPLPLAITRHAAVPLKRVLEEVTAKEKFDAIVCDFLHSAPNVPAIEKSVLFQHNVEATIWKRHAAVARHPLLRWYYRWQARQMHAYEGRMCRSARHVIAVSAVDAERIRDAYGISEVSVVATGVDIEHFLPPSGVSIEMDLVFTGSMDWQANVDCVRYFVRDVLPIIRHRRPNCRLTIVGRRPTPEVCRLAEHDPLISVTGTVDDIRPYLWKAAVAIVPLRIAGGTRLKIYEAAAARVPIVSTTIGAEGLDLVAGSEILIGDSPLQFADHCLALLEAPDLAQDIREAAWQKVHEHYSWQRIAFDFERLLENAAKD